MAPSDGASRVIATIGGASGQALVAVVRVPISFVVNSGGGSVNPGSTTTDMNGVTRATWQLGTQGGAQTALAASPSLSGISVLFDAFAGIPAANFCPTQSYAIGSVVSGILDTTDCRFSAPHWQMMGTLTRSRL